MDRRTAWRRGRLRPTDAHLLIFPLVGLPVQLRLVDDVQLPLAVQQVQDVVQAAFLLRGFGLVHGLLSLLARGIHLRLDLNVLTRKISCLLHQDPLCVLAGKGRACPEPKLRGLPHRSDRIRREGPLFPLGRRELGTALDGGFGLGGGGVRLEALPGLVDPPLPLSPTREVPPVLSLLLARRRPGHRPLDRPLLLPSQLLQLGKLCAAGVGRHKRW